MDINLFGGMKQVNHLKKHITNNAIDFLSNKFYNVKKLNEIIPLSKHNEYCSDIYERNG